MPKLPRVTSVLFGGGGPGTDFGQFGSKTAGTPQTEADYGSLSAFIAGCQALSAWVTGWAIAAVGAAFNPYLEDMNGAFIVFSYFINNVFERGIPDWDAGTTYYKGAVVGDPAGSGQYFYSLTDGNLNNALPLGASNAQWKWLNAPQLPIGSVLETMALTADPDFILADGSAVSRTTYAALFTKASKQVPGTLVAGSPVITGIPSTANLPVGCPISGTGIPSGAKILSVDSGTQVTMTLNALSNQSVATLTFAPWGVGDGVTTFNLLDSRRRVGMGAGGVGSALVPNAVGTYAGEETHTLTIAEMPSHTHTVPQPINNFTKANGSDAVCGGSSPVNSGATGGDGAHNNVQPVYVCTKQIKYQ